MHWARLMRSIAIESCDGQVQVNFSLLEDWPKKVTECDVRTCLYWERVTGIRFPSVQRQTKQFRKFVDLLLERVGAVASIETLGYFLGLGREPRAKGAHIGFAVGIG